MMNHLYFLCFAVFSNNNFSTFSGTLSGEVASDIFGVASSALNQPALGGLPVSVAVSGNQLGSFSAHLAVSLPPASMDMHVQFGSVDCMGYSGDSTKWEGSGAIKFALAGTLLAAQAVVQYNPCATNEQPVWSVRSETESAFMLGGVGVDKVNIQLEGYQTDAGTVTWSGLAVGSVTTADNQELSAELTILDNEIKHFIIDLQYGSQGVSLQGQ
jgi:hypothetical protein